eukprot:UN21414
MEPDHLLQTACFLIHHHTQIIFFFIALATPTICQLESSWQVVISELCSQSYSMQNSRYRALQSFLFVVFNQNGFGQFWLFFVDFGCFESTKMVLVDFRRFW